MDIHLNHKKEHRRICLYYAIGLNIIFILMILTYVYHDYLRENYLSHSLSVSVQISFFVALQACTSTVITISFIIFIYNIHKRFSVLNSILRFRFLLLRMQTKLSFFWVPFLFCNFSIFIPNRNRFLNKKELNISIIVNQKDESINVIKFIGRQHLQLTDLMDQLNFCYSFQVNFDQIQR